MRCAMLLLLSGSLTFLLGACAGSNDGVPTTTEAYEIEQERRYQQDKRERDLEWR